MTISAMRHEYSITWNEYFWKEIKAKLILFIIYTRFLLFNYLAILEDELAEINYHETIYVLQKRYFLKYYFMIIM